MPNHLTPGVYVEEVPSGARSIQGVGTTTAAFVGRAPATGARLHEAVPVNGWAQFVREFAPPGIPGTSLARAVYGFFENGGRRCFIFVEESIALGTHWTVFEPNDPTLWKSIHRDVSAFLLRLWRDGALMGRTKEEAFLVQCDEQTNTKESIDAGQVVAVIGLAPVKAAEFIIFRIGQHAGGAEVEEVSNG